MRFFKDIIKYHGDNDCYDDDDVDGTWQGEKRRVGSQMAAFKKSAAVRSSAWRDFDPSLRQEFSQEGTYKMKFIEILSKMIARY